MMLMQLLNTADLLKDVITSIHHQKCENEQLEGLFFK